jgi:hypothetical protein
LLRRELKREVQSEARESGDFTATVGERQRRRREQFEGKWAEQRVFIGPQRLKCRT